MIEIFNILRKQKKTKNNGVVWCPTEVIVVPHLKNSNIITCEPGDTLIARIDTDYIDLKDFGVVLEALEKQFPNNNVLCVPKAIEIQKVSN